MTEEREHNPAPARRSLASARAVCSLLSLSSPTGHPTIISQSRGLRYVRGCFMCNTILVGAGGPAAGEGSRQAVKLHGASEERRTALLPLISSPWRAARHGRRRSSRRAPTCVGTCPAIRKGLRCRRSARHYAGCGRGASMPTGATASAAAPAPRPGLNRH
ncbi:hypothetical protein BDA96_02G248700 [Sorghum bicolor]|uniref:Uncharacterized protein n=2 Tax=Sorghum bicolor TaxID=4558 RepID=A0A921RPD5_SORBI|nr:hypothetical protein BDA96_02G248700 [Sorghum bicolor]OQU89659.1 hypothetical protein SORBI_3002G237750 [Sorghum bicolor]